MKTILKARALVCFLIAGLLGLEALAAWDFFLRGNDGEKEIFPVGTLPSRSHAWVAVVKDRVYGSPIVGDASVSSTVQLVRHARPEEMQPDPSYVVEMDDDSHPDYRLSVQWVGPRRLRISAPDKSAVFLEKVGYEDVETVIEYPPDDPAERARFLRERGLLSK
jgi:hypothetical protein